uniref:Uncharacterized protein n=1 Tax=Chromera velia CCMP2878 TaxID=1169474 RepID=A0A0G4HYK3_9ALVE|eukprot:Cvel_33631.t1-p1 / transcript=Cvel_33631.t1 / gene=Cvel_33631 / organism=Chromera_velia_CCMP2878 / gene_product=hypothetical protein / transcript_product=hypothetical protein / location=Cvel_scaffold5511:1233-2988(-) / protein_length=316 / sequence_SO=supercontig / SO=protein_coding / is_pseudo=false
MNVKLRHCNEKTQQLADGLTKFKKFDDTCTRIEVELKRDRASKLTPSHWRSPSQMEKKRIYMAKRERDGVLTAEPPPNISSAGSRHVYNQVSLSCSHEDSVFFLFFKRDSMPVTGIYFLPSESRVASASTDMSVRIWSVDTGEMLQIFRDTAESLAIAVSSLNPRVLVSANSSASLRLLDLEIRNIPETLNVQTLQMDSTVSALAFDLTGYFCIAGTKKGDIHVVEISDDLRMTSNLQFRLSSFAVTCIALVPSLSLTNSSSSIDSQKLLVACAEPRISIVTCVYKWRLSEQRVLSDLKSHDESLATPFTVLFLRV